MECTDLAQDRDRCRALWSAVMNFWIPQNLLRICSVHKKDSTQWISSSSNSSSGGGGSI
jgi:hypothetical protein